MNRVLIIEAQMKRYRVPFYERLFAALRSDGFHLQVAYSEPRGFEKLRDDHCGLPAEYGLQVRGYWIFDRLLIQPLLRQVASADLVISDEGNRYLLNHLLLPFARCGLKKVAMWGMGQIKQTEGVGFSEWYKSRALHWISWWFAYNSGTVRYLMERGFPGDRITLVQNAVDTREIVEWIARFAPSDIMAVRSRLGIPTSARVGIYCGSLDKVKNLPFLVESARLVRQQIQDFHLVIVGAGTEVAYVEEQSALNKEWFHWVGAKFGREKAMVLKTADVFMIPGAVGLAILDSFAARLPVLTTRIPIHGPEIEYLEDGYNGLMTEPNPKAYADAVTRLLSTPHDLTKLKAGAQASCQKYSIETMVNNFHRGILDCLSWN